MKKVLIYRSKLLPYSETFIKAQAEALTTWDYTFCGESLCHELPLDLTKVLLLPKKSRGFLAKVVYFFYKIKRNQFIQKLRALNFDLLHVHFGTDAVDIAYLSELLNIPLVVTLHGFDINIDKEVWESGARGKKNTQYPAKLITLSRQKNVHFIAVSEAIKHRAIAFGLPAEKVTVCYIGVDVKQFQPNNTQLLTNKNILYIGRMVEKKGAEILIKAFAKVFDCIPDAKLVMIGDGENLNSHRILAQQRNLPVAFVGVKSSSEVISYLNNTRVFCLPSITAKNGDAEGLGIVILEAQACGVPVVTSARGGATEGIIHGETGFAFEEGDVEALAKYLMQLLEDDALTSSMSRRGVQFIKNQFNIATCTQKLESYYDNLAK